MRKPGPICSRRSCSRERRNRSVPTRSTKGGQNAAEARTSAQGSTSDMVSPMPRQTPRRLIAVASAGVGLLVAASLTTPDLVAQTDLDAFMRQVLVRRDENWKKLQQYVLDEHETIDVRGPSRLPLWGERREYTWYIRDGFFVRSPVKVNGVTI